MLIFYQNGHKENCTHAKITGLRVSQRAKIECDVDEHKYDVLHHRTGPCVVVREPGTGRLFESLSNQDVVFIPDEFL